MDVTENTKPINNMEETIISEMGVKKYKIQNADLASSVEKVITEFINQ